MCGVQRERHENHGETAGPWDGPADAVSLHRLQWRG